MDSELEALSSAAMLKGIHHRAQDDAAKTSDTGKSFPKELRLGLAIWLSLPCVSPLQKLLTYFWALKPPHPSTPPPTWTKPLGKARGQILLIWVHCLEQEAKNWIRPCPEHEGIAVKSQAEHQR